jgi:hypothetical protein
MQRRSWLPAAAILLLACSRVGGEPASKANAAEPRVLARGPHLLLDDHLIERSEGIARRVIPPRRFLETPIVTGSPEHQNWQPFFTVVHDPAAAPERRFRMWYNADVVDDPADGEFFGKTAYLESADGVRWPGPYRRIESLAEDGRVRFGADVLDEGPQHAPSGERFKMMYFDAGRFAGPRVAFSGDGLEWTMHDGGKPIHAVTNSDDIWSAGFDPLRRRYFLLGKVYGPHTWTNAEGRTVAASIRRYATSFSPDYKTWSEPEMAFTPDERDPGITQWYGAAGFQVRGDLILGFLRVLRDDLSPEGAPQEAIDANSRGPAGLGASGLGADGGSGMGYTVLTWTRDGRTWIRDREACFEPDPQVAAWDHAMAWIGSAVPVGDDVYLYYAGYRWGHKYRHSVDRQIGLIKAKRDRFVAREAGEEGGTLTTPLLMLDAESLSLNVNAEGGEARVQVCNAAGEPIAGFAFADCRPIASDALAANIEWSKPLSSLRGQAVRLQFALRSAQIFAFQTQ